LPINSPFDIVTLTPLEVYSRNFELEKNILVLFQQMYLRTKEIICNYALAFVNF